MAFALPAGVRSVAIASRAASPLELGLMRDPRPLGVAIRAVEVWKGKTLRDLSAAEPALSEGFHGYEPEDDLRWTNGMAVLPQALFDGLTGPLTLQVQLAGTAQYRLEPGDMRLDAVA